MFGVPESEVGAARRRRRLSTSSSSAAAPAYFSAWLARQGARPVGVDVTPAQLDTARRLQAETGIEFPLIEASAEDVPLPDASFDLAVLRVRGEHLVRPVSLDSRGVPVAPSRRSARVPGEQPARDPLCARRCPKATSETLQRPQRGMHKFAWADGGVEFHLGHGDMFRVLRDAGLRGRGARRALRRPTKPRRTSTTTSSPPTGRASGRPRRSGRRASPSDSRVDVAAAPRDPRAARDPVRRRRSRLRRGRPARRRPRPSSFAGTRRERRAPSTRTARSRSASTRPSSSTGVSTARRRSASDARHMLQRALGPHAHGRLGPLPARRRRGRRRARADGRDVPAADGGDGRRVRRERGVGGACRRATRSRVSAVGSSSGSRATTSTSSGSRARCSSRSSRATRQSSCKPAGRLAAPHGLVQVHHRVRRPRHGRGSRHRQHARLRARSRHRALRAVGRRDRPAHG